MIEWLAPVLSAGASFVSNIFGWNRDKKNREAQQTENEITREREDSAIQRRVEDAKAANVNPLAALGVQGAASSSQPAPMHHSENQSSAMQRSLQRMQSHDLLASIALKDKQGEEAAAKARQANAQADVLEETVPTIAPESESLVNQRLADTSLKEAQGEYYDALRGKTTEETEKLVHEVSGLVLDNSRKKLSNQLYQKYEPTMQEFEKKLTELAIQGKDLLNKGYAQDNITKLWESELKSWSVENEKFTAMIKQLDYDHQRDTGMKSGTGGMLGSLASGFAEKTGDVLGGFIDWYIGGWKQLFAKIKRP